VWPKQKAPENAGALNFIPELSIIATSLTSASGARWKRPAALAGKYLPCIRRTAMESSHHPVRLKPEL
jgi:hypothetical protein